MAAAVCSSELACCSVREERSWLPASISPEAVAMLSAPERTCPTTWARLSFIWRSACSNWPVSSRESTVMRLVRSLLATVRATRRASASGLVMPRVIHQAASAPSTKASETTVMMAARLAEKRTSTSAAELSMAARCMSSRRCTISI
ncbi:hypothetical protein KDK82_1937 [Delftia sp. K82]|nr:hypothetical protein KDK82_1937 [Delftia sp. K82]